MYVEDTPVYSRVTEAVRAAMVTRDEAAKAKHESKFGPIPTTAMEVGADVIHTITLVNKELYGFDYEEFRLTANSRYSYAQDADLFPQTPLEEIFSGRWSVHKPTIFKAAYVPSSAYSEALERAGMTKQQFRSDVVDKLKAIGDNAVAKRLIFARALRESAAMPAYIKASFTVHRMGHFLNELMCPDAECDDCCSILKCCFLLPFQITFAIILFPIFVLLWIFPNLFACIYDLLRCYSCRIDMASKRAAVDAAMAAHPECENKAVNDAIKAEIDKLASELRNKYPSLRVNVTCVPTFMCGMYFNVYEPAHTDMFWNLEFRSVDGSSIHGNSNLKTVMPV